MSTTPNARSAYEPDNAIARLVLKDPAIVSNAHESDDALVLAVRSQLLVHQSIFFADTRLRQELEKIGKQVGTVAGAGRAADAAGEQKTSACPRRSRSGGSTIRRRTRSTKPGGCVICQAP